MIQTEHTFQNKDNIDIFYHQWMPDNADIRAVIFIVHGHGEHSGRYRQVAESFTEAGFVCYGIDHLGHGKSGGTRIYIKDMGYAVNDLRQLFEMVTPQYPDKPVLIFGHSMGSLISLEFTLRYQSDLAGLALTGTAITGAELLPSWLVSLAKQAAKIFPKVRLSPPGSPDVLTTDVQMVQEMSLDPLIDTGMWRIGTSSAMISSGLDLQKRVHQLTLPMLVMHGGADTLTPSSGAIYLEEHVQSDDLTVKIYPGLRHELVNEIGRDEIIQEITDWLVAHS